MKHFSSLFPQSEKNEQGIVRETVFSWDWGRHHALPLWVEFVARSTWDRTIICEDLMPSCTVFELPLFGSLQVKTIDDAFTISEGECGVLPAGIHRTLKPDGGDGCRKISFGICGNCSPGILSNLGFHCIRTLTLSNAESICKKIEECRRWLHEKEESCIPKISAAAMEILIDISFQSQAQIPMELGQAMRLMEFGMSQRISVCEISQTIGVSPIRLRHLFLEHTGMLPKQYQLKFRMQHAYSLLRNQKLSVAETANKVGYVNASVFIREFRNFFGKTPLDVTKQ